MEHVQCITTEWIHVLPGSGKLAAYGGKKKKNKKRITPTPRVHLYQTEPISTEIRKNWPNYG